MIRTEGPSAAILELDGYAWRRPTRADRAALEELSALGPDAGLFNLPGPGEEFSRGVGGPGFRMPMLCIHGSRPVGVAAISHLNQRSMNAQLICAFKQPRLASHPLAIYVRHLFWSQPLHRVYVQFPVAGDATDYIDVLKRAGFVDEGVVTGYALVRGQPSDVAVLGILRREFEAWCLQNEKRLIL